MHKPKERPGAASPGPTYMSSAQMEANVTVGLPAATETRRHSHQRTTSNMSIDEVLVGRPLVQPPRGRNMSSSMSARDRTPSIQYREDGQRQVEREEARALRIAMDELDFNQEHSLYNAARDEAAELVWKHRNPDAPGANPNAPYAYPGADEKSGHQRSRTNADFGPSPTKETFGKISDAPVKLPKVSSTPSDPNHRRRSSGGRRKVSGSLFRNPDDQIYEEPEEDVQAAAPTPASAPVVAEAPPPAKLPLQVRRNPFSRVQFARDHSLVRSSTDPIVGSKRFDRFEIQRNPPSQTRNAAYTSNQPVASAKEGLKPGTENEPEVQMKDGKEIRGDDIRAATSMRMRDRSPKLPTPTIVSDAPGRPIVSFTENLKPKEVELKEEISTAPSISVTPVVPSISVNGPAVPSINVNGPSVPSINVNGPPASTRPLPNPKNHSSRSIPQNRPTTNTRSHWTPAAAVRTGALCTHCALPIAGRIVSAAGSRFHPECFACHHCGEHLECVAFYPEPENKYAERVARIQARIRGDDIEYLPTHPTPSDMMRLEEEDGDETMRFFCHLDFHELYSPRCKSCKTPIEGEVIVACGAEWHVGHFFCAQCGDPFDSSTPFVEKEGYAWCVGCHTNRFSTKCKKCRRPVTDTVVKALGQEWHAGCFVCAECEGPFTDGRYFLRGESQDPVCVRCEERRLKA
ncbi:hypothetical protein P154DRAFT_486990 [Amniculicola lignicola CBS 123094]|uniref:LIM zinc-binding domain-containing protein n=1 Tax=Amniculicola lignicola CBS 123094 TaxID=1392246 RepID=A0A6A5WSS3_9PLEO|nr:hypothetical protein P154DRAFT_486990 [Amniculicola lignicola CBS 123094]